MSNNEYIWLAELISNDPQQRYHAIRSLAAGKVSQAVKPMLELLQNHPDLLTRWEIIKALPAILTDEDIQWLVAACRDNQNREDWQKRIWLQLGLIGVDTPYIRRQFEYSHWSVDYLLKLRDGYSGDLIAELIELAVLPKARTAIVHALDKWQGAEAFPYLYQLSQHFEDFDVWQSVMLSLVSPGEDDEVNHQLRARAIAFYEPILYAESASMTDRAMAIGVLGSMDCINQYVEKPIQYAARILEFLADEKLHFYVAYTFDAVFYPEAVPALIAALRAEDILSENEEQQYTPGWVIAAMRKQKDLAVVPKIRETLEIVRQWSAVGSLPEHSLLPANSFVNSAADALTEFSSFDELDGERLLAMLYDPGIDTKAAVSLVKAIGKSKYRVALDRLLQMASPEFRTFFDRNFYHELLEQIAYAFGEIGNRKAYTTLVQLLNSSSDKVQVQAAHALKKLDDPQGLDQLLRIVQDEKIAGITRSAAVLALADFQDPRVVPALVQAVQMQYPTTGAGDLLIQRQASEAIELLKPLLNDINERVQKEAQRILKALEAGLNRNSE